MEKPKPKSKAKPKPDRKKSDQNGDGRVNPPVAGENPKYADSLFTMLFKTKEEVLNLHRTLHPEDEITADSILLCTLRNVVINNRYNDLAYLVDNRLIILIEHQTTKNPNLPLRLLLYLALEYERIIREMGIDLFGKSLHRLPAPEFYVVYTGREQWEVKELKLSDAFQGEAGWMELRVKIIRQGQMDSKDSLLEQYLELIQKIWEYREAGYSTREAIRQAIEDCINRGILKEFLQERKMEVSRVLWDQCVNVDLVERERKEKERERKEKEQERKEKERERKEKERERREKEQERIDTVRMLKGMGFSDEEVVQKLCKNYRFSEAQARAILDAFYENENNGQQAGNL